MAQSKRPLHMNVTPESFDVTCVLGTVVLDGTGNESPSMAAFRLITEHDTPGTFTFPNAWGGTTRVLIEAPALDNDRV